MDTTESLREIWSDMLENNMKKVGNSIYIINHIASTFSSSGYEITINTGIHIIWRSYRVITMQLLYLDEMTAFTDYIK